MRGRAYVRIRRVTFDSLTQTFGYGSWPLQRARAIIREALYLTDICLPSWDDITAIAGWNDRDAIVDCLLGYGAELAALKLGT
ncbi:hypothetical protein SAMN05216345_11779 [Cupriavidus sp. YR651]|nr:hypothetical protein SAMN05216345_11779 [Cupriavidus sp. YR651]